MDPLQTDSLKIQKKTRNTQFGTRNYICGCSKQYKSYPSLYLHIRRKHDGIKPPNTITSKKPFVLAPEEKTSSIKPQPSLDIDEIGGTKLDLEKIENDFFTFSGDRLNSICALSSKPTLQDVIIGIKSNNENVEDEYLKHIRQKAEELCTQMRQGETGEEDIELEYETVKDTGPRANDMRLAWFLLYLSRHIVKRSFIPDLSFVFSRIWKILSQLNLGIRDLNNELVWNQTHLECQPHTSELVYFKQKAHLLLEFIKKLCQFIEKTFE